MYEASGGGTAAREGAHASVLARGRRDGALLSAFVAATFTAAGLVFLVQPIAARLESVTRIGICPWERPDRIVRWPAFAASIAMSAPE